MMMEFLDYFEPELEKIAADLKKAEGGALLGGEAARAIRQGGHTLLRPLTESYARRRLAELVKDENPFALSDFRMITRKQQETAVGALLGQLRSGQRTLPSRMVKTVETVLGNYARFLASMLKNLAVWRKEISETLLQGRVYTEILDLALSGDSHNHGKCTVILETDAGKLVYKPRSCRADEAAFRFINRYFSDVIRVPAVFTRGDEFGVCEFLEKQAAEGMEEARRYYDALGGTAAVIRALGSADMHLENLFAVKDRIAVVDLETLLYPARRNPGRRYRDLYGEKNAEALGNSLADSAFLNRRYEKDGFSRDLSILMNTEEEGSAPVVDGVRRSVHGFEEVFLEGFTEIYRRCIARRDAMMKDIPELFSTAVFRMIVQGTQKYAEIIRRLNSSYSYDSEAYYASQLAKLPRVLEGNPGETGTAVPEHEIRAVLDGEIPLFYTFGGSRDLWYEGKKVSEGYFRSSAVERAQTILAGLDEKDLAFETAFLRRSIAMAKRKAVRPPVPGEADRPLPPERAKEEAFRIMEEIHRQALPLTDGELTWLTTLPGTLDPDIMMHGLYSGVAGLGVFFAAVLSCAGEHPVRAAARKCLDSVLAKLERFCNPAPSEGVGAWRLLGPGEADGLAGVVKAVVLINRILEGETDSLLRQGIAMFAGLEPSDYRTTDKAGGIAGLICVLCRYEELYREQEIRNLIRGLCGRLSALRTLPCGDRVLWKTLAFRDHPISGAVHGMLGIWEAFTLAGRVLGTDRYAEDAEAAFAFEAAAYNGKQGEWMDLRIPGSQKPARGNCYGAEGIGIILNRMEKNGSVAEAVRLNAVRADRAVRAHPAFPLDHLCCGNMSAAEYYLETGDFAAAGLRLAEVLQAKEINGIYRLGEAGCVPNNNVTLFYGLAGIGYELLRYAFPGKLPSVV